MSGIASYMVGGALQGAGQGLMYSELEKAKARRETALANERAKTAEQRDERLAAAKQREPFTIGRKRLRFEPDTGETETLYEGDSDAEEYAGSLGLVPGTEEHKSAMKDYILRGNGPTAMDYDRELDDHRTDNRSRIERERQANRRALRETPAYRDLHPPEPKAASESRPRPLRKSQAGRPAAVSPNGDRVEWNGKAWVPVR